MALTRDHIVAKALELMDEHGLTEVSTRRIASQLGVKSPALYKHFTDKADLLGAMAASMLKETFDLPIEGDDWSDWLYRIACNARLTLLRHRDGARLLIASSPDAPPRVMLATVLAQPLQRQGFVSHDARLALAIIASFVTGWVLNEQLNPEDRLMSFGRPSIDEAFEDGVRATLGGLGQLRGAGSLRNKAQAVTCGRHVPVRS